MKIQKFIINKLHGTLSYELEFKDNTLILIGENGSCKTTIIKMLFYTLSMQWQKLVQYKFESIILCINNQKYTISKRSLASSVFLNNRILRRFPLHIRRELMSMQEDRELNFEMIENLCNRYDIPVERVIRDIDEANQLDLLSHYNSDSSTRKTQNVEEEKIKDSLKNTHILYLPTYRRIEQELQDVVRGRFSENDYRPEVYNIDANYTELIEFGMSDVDKAIEQTLANLKDLFRNNLNQLTLGYLGDIVNEEYKSTDVSKIKEVDDITIHNIMDRVDNSILSEKNKDKLFQTLQQIKEGGAHDDRDRVVCHYFFKLLESQRELEQKETNIRKFVEVCGKYLMNKTIKYDSPTFTFSIKSNIDDQDIKLNQLSSGEKQVVSLFSQLYLANKQKYFVLIDEPELSLSVKWQKTFLADVRSGDFCNGLVAVTHSPFIFDNELDKYARGLGEFIKL